MAPSARAGEASGSNLIFTRDKARLATVRPHSEKRSACTSSMTGVRYTTTVISADMACASESISGCEVALRTGDEMLKMYVSGVMFCLVLAGCSSIRLARFNFAWAQQ